MYLLTVYANTPQARWSGSPPAHDVLIEETLPLLWLARWRARALYAQFIPGRVGWLIRRGDRRIAEFAEHVACHVASNDTGVAGNIIAWPKHLED